MSLICGIDIGGTFTDCVLIDESGEISITKTPSTPDEFSRGFFDALQLLAEGRGVEVDELLADLTVLAHGTTVATNAVIERHGSRVGLLATAGHGDAILMMRAYGRVAGLSADELLRMSRTSKPEPLVPKRLIREVQERVDSDGDVVVELDEEQAQRAIDELIAEGVDGIAISLLWSFKNPRHEHRLKEMVLASGAELFVTCSTDLVPRMGEYERTVATVMNVYVGAVTSRYVDAIEQRARTSGLASPFLLMQCNGGLASSEKSKRSPVLLLQSGPCGGVVGSNYLGQLLGHENVIATDMGGTTFDVGIIHGNEPVRVDSTIVDRYEYYVPTIDVQSVGAGGGSLAWFDDMRDAIRVGPQSAGAMPGPACYGRGGVEPTVTDADVVLGYLSGDHFLEGRSGLDREAALRAVARVAEPAGMDVVEAAAGIAKIVDLHMADLIRRMTIQKGFDPRDFVVFAYGGAGPSHAGVFARELGAKEVVVPLANAASVWSALGVASSDVVHVFEREHVMTLPVDPDGIRDARDEMRAAALDQLEREGFTPDEIDLRWSADMRHHLQVHVVQVAIPLEGDISPTSLESMSGRFERTYENLYGEGTAYAAAGIEMVVLRCTARGRVARPTIRAADPTPSRPGDDAKAPAREAYWPALGRTVITEIYLGARLEPGDVVEGPAIIHLPVTTVVVHPDQQARIDGYGNLVLTV